MEVLNVVLYGHNASYNFNDQSVCDELSVFSKFFLTPYWTILLDCQFGHDKGN